MKPWQIIGVLVIAALLFGAGYFTCKKWDHVLLPDDQALRDAAKADSLEQAKWIAYGDSLQLSADSIQAFRDSLSAARARKPIIIHVDEIKRAMASAPISVHVDSMELLPIRR